MTKYLSEIRQPTGDKQGTIERLSAAIKDAELNKRDRINIAGAEMNLEYAKTLLKYLRGPKVK